MRDRWTESEHPQEMTRQQRNTFSILHTVADLHRAEQANSVTVLRPQETGTVHGARITLVTVNWSSHSSALFVFHLRHCMSEYADADMQNAVREQWKWGSVFQNLKERGKKKGWNKRVSDIQEPKSQFTGTWSNRQNNFVLHSRTKSELSLQNRCFSSSERDNTLCPF